MAQIRIATLADAVEAGPGRKFNVLGGGINELQARQFPVALTRLSLLLAIEMGLGEADETKVSISFKGADGKEFMHAEMGLSKRAPDAAPAGVIWAGMDLPPITVKAAGRIDIEASTGESKYKFHLDIRGPAAPLFPPPAGSMSNN